MKTIRQVGIRGIVAASQWDEDGRPTGVTVLTRDELEFDIESNEVGAGLLAHLTREVVVCGHLGAGRDGRRVLRPHSFAVMDEEKLAGSTHEAGTMA
jgi:hypothetical protein